MPVLSTTATALSMDRMIRRFWQQLGHVCLGWAHYSGADQSEEYVQQPRLYGNGAQTFLEPGTSSLCALGMNSDLRVLRFSVSDNLTASLLQAV